MEFASAPAKHAAARRFQSAGTGAAVAERKSKFIVIDKRPFTREGEPRAEVWAELARKWEVVEQAQDPRYLRILDRLDPRVDCDAPDVERVLEEAIDLLTSLREKTMRNLSVPERTAHDELLLRLQRQLESLKPWDEFDLEWNW